MEGTSTMEVALTVGRVLASFLSSGLYTLALLVSKLLPLVLVALVAAHFDGRPKVGWRPSLVSVLCAACVLLLSSVPMLGIDLSLLHPVAVIAGLASAVTVAFVSVSRDIAAVSSNATLAVFFACIGQVTGLPYRLTVAPVFSAIFALAAFHILHHCGKRLNRPLVRAVGLCYVVIWILQVEIRSESQRFPARLDETGRCFQVRGPNEETFSLLRMLGCFIGPW